MLQNIVERVGRARLLDNVVVAWPTEHEDENNLVARLLRVAKQYEADCIIRICADNPCVEPEQIDHLIKGGRPISDPCRSLLMNSEDFEFESDGFGGEYYTLEMLQWMDRTIKDPYYREHVSYFWRDLDLCDYYGVDYPRGFRLDVNTQEDYEKLVRIYDHFGNNEFHVDEAVKFVQENLEKRNFPSRIGSSSKRL